ncbi:MAG: hypothetical protein JWS12_455 [Candidatus Saccharibacteria bacterium]|nr:hypothetical protein [Candidatus Saccharibacteria bacterium]
MAMNGEGGSPETTLGQKIQDARQAAGLTQQQLCQKAGLSYSTLAKIERGAIKSPSIFTIQQIAGVLGIGLEQLVGQASSPALSSKKVSKSGIRFVYFDINGCLVRFFHRAFSEIAEASHTPADIIESTFWHFNDAACRGEMSIEAFNQTLGERFSMPDFNWNDYYLLAIDPIEEMKELLGWAANNYQVGLLSNIMPGQIKAMQAKHLLPEVPYTAIIDSSEVHAIKPEPEIYAIAAQRANCQPQEILLVDDSRTNLMAAEHLGWHVLWFDDFNPAASIERIRTALEPAN